MPLGVLAAYGAYRAVKAAHWYVSIRPINELHDIAKAARSAREQIQASQPDRLEQMGRQFFELSHEDYLTKAEGGVGRDGIRWAPNKPETIRRKLRTRGIVRGPGAIHRTLFGGSDQAADFYGIPGFMIGVDTGATLAAAEPEGSPDTVFEIDTDSILVGYGTAYAWYFDAERELIPDPLPEEYVKPLEAIVFEGPLDIVESEFAEFA